MELVRGQFLRPLAARIPTKRVVQVAGAAVALYVVSKFATWAILAKPRARWGKGDVVMLNLLTFGGRTLSSSDFPTQPVPTLKRSIDKYLASMEHLLDPEEVDELKSALKDRKLKVAHAMIVLWAMKCAGAFGALKHFYRFLGEQSSLKEGFALLVQAKEILSAMKPTPSIGIRVSSTNWQRLPWYLGAYLCHPMIHTGWFGTRDKLERRVESTNPRAVRGAYMLHSMERFWSKVRLGHRELPVDPNAWLSQWQLGYVGTVEKAGPTGNMLVDNRGKRGVVIVSNGIPCYVPKLPTTPEACCALICAVEKATRGKRGNLANIVTWVSGTEGHALREKFAAIGDNRRKLALLDSRVFTLHLADHSPESLTEMAYEVFGPKIFDQCWGGSTVTAVQTSAYSLSYSSHAACEATAVAATKMDGEVLARELGTMDGKVLVMPDLMGEKECTTAFEVLEFEVDGLESELRSHREKMASALADRDIFAGRFPRLNKERIKGVRCSPDGMMQFAIQLAFYRCFKRHTQTYQTMTTRTFDEGRTETVRPATALMKEAVEAFGQGGDALKALLKRVFAAHRDEKIACMDGEGCDRILQIMQGFTAETEHSPDLYNTAAWKAPWDLVTSQTPTNTLGGGFTNWTSDGFAVSYCQDHPDELTFHVVGSKSRTHTVTAEQFGGEIAKALEDTIQLFET